VRGGLVDAAKVFVTQRLRCRAWATAYLPHGLDGYVAARFRQSDGAPGRSMPGAGRARVPGMRLEGFAMGPLVDQPSNFLQKPDDAFFAPSSRHIAASTEEQSADLERPRLVLILAQPYRRNIEVLREGDYARQAPHAGMRASSNNSNKQ